MTMQQIKRKIELELENKRDELFNSIEMFVENQKKFAFSLTKIEGAIGVKLFKIRFTFFTPFS